MTAALPFEASYQEIAIGHITANPDQPRKLFARDALDELAESIRVNGLLQAIVVRKTGNPDDLDHDCQPYMIVAGERRWRACQQAGLTHIPCRVIAGLDDDAAFVLSVLENVARADMTVSEEAKAFAQLTATGRTPAEVAGLFGKTPDYVTWRIGLLGLSSEHLALLDRGAIGTTLAYYAAKLSPAGQQVVVRKAVRGEFATDSAAVAFAQAIEAQERQGFFMEVQEMVAAQAQSRAQAADAAPAPTEIDELLVALRTVTERVAALFPGAAKPRDLAGRHGLDSSTCLEYVSDLADAAVAARRVLRKAAAIVEVAQTKHARSIQSS